jgi:hypothetical protein
MGVPMCHLNIDRSVVTFYIFSFSFGLSVLVRALTEVKILPNPGAPPQSPRQRERHPHFGPFHGEANEKAKSGCPISNS